MHRKAMFFVVATALLIGATTMWAQDSQKSGGSGGLLNIIQNKLKSLKSPIPDGLTSRLRGNSGRTPQPTPAQTPHQHATGTPSPQGVSTPSQSVPTPTVTSGGQHVEGSGSANNANSAPIPVGADDQKQVQHGTTSKLHTRIAIMAKPVFPNMPAPTSVPGNEAIAAMPMPTPTVPRPTTPSPTAPSPDAIGTLPGTTPGGSTMTQQNQMISSSPSPATPMAPPMITQQATPPPMSNPLPIVSTPTPTPTPSPISGTVTSQPDSTHVTEAPTQVPVTQTPEEGLVRPYVPKPVEADSQVGAPYVAVTPTQSAPVSPAPMEPAVGGSYGQSSASGSNGTTPDSWASSQTTGQNTEAMSMGSSPSLSTNASTIMTGESGRSQAVLIARGSPIMQVETLGPRAITVGKESVYKINVSNSGSVAADRVVVGIDLPSWANVAGAAVSSGATNMSQNITQMANDQTAAFVWEVGKVNALGRETLELRIIPRKREAFDLKVNLDFRQESSEAKIVVQEPEIQFELDGPNDVLWGEKKIYKLHVKNIGNGDATNVRLSLAPIDGQGQRKEHPIDLISAGQDMVIELELAAGQTGQLTIDVTATGDDGVQARLTKQIGVRRAALEVAVKAPELRFVGNQAVYTIQIRNNGTAAAKSVSLVASIPSNAKYVSNVGGGRSDTNHKKVTWDLAELAIGSERTLTLTCELTGEGNSLLDVVATAATDLSASGNAMVRVEAMADLSLAISDPSGPVAVGEDALFRITVTNRGTKRAENVAIIASFTQGIEPVRVDGGKHRIPPGDGQVVFDPVLSIAPGQKVEMTIHAKADQAGNHRCRVQVDSELGTRLSSEESTFFYMNETAQSSAGTTPIEPGTSGLQEMPTQGPSSALAEQLPAALAPQEPLPSTSPSPFKVGTNPEAVPGNATAEPLPQGSVIPPAPIAENSIQTDPTAIPVVGSKPESGTSLN